MKKKKKKYSIERKNEKYIYVRIDDINISLVENSQKQIIEEHVFCKKKSRKRVHEDS